MENLINTTMIVICDIFFILYFDAGKSAGFDCFGVAKRSCTPVI